MCHKLIFMKCWKVEAVMLSHGHWDHLCICVFIYLPFYRICVYLICKDGRRDAFPWALGPCRGFDQGSWLDCQRKRFSRKRSRYHHHHHDKTKFYFLNWCNQYWKMCSLISAILTFWYRTCLKEDQIFILLNLVFTHRIYLIDKIVYN